MSLLFMDGFDNGDSNTSGKWDAFTGASVQTTAPQLHGAYLALNQAGFAQYRIPAASEHATVTIGANVYFNAGQTNDDGTAGSGIFRFLGDAAATPHVTITIIRATGQIRARLGAGNGTILGTSAAEALISSDAWAHIAAKVTLHDSTGTVDVEVNGVNVLSFSGDTKNAGTDAVFDSVQVRNGSNGGNNSRRFDDVYVLNGTDSGVGGLPNNNFLGVVRVGSYLPTADSTPEDWSHSTGTNSAALIDEATPNGDTDYIFSDTPTHKTQVAVADIAETDVEVFGVQVAASARKADAGDATFRMGISSDSVAANGSDRLLLETYQSYLEVFEADPDGGGAWTRAQVNAAEVFVEVRG